MSEQTTMHVAEGMSVGVVGQRTWRDALLRIVDGVVPTVDEDVLASWDAAGIITPEGIDPQWERALRLAQTSTVGVEIVATYSGVTFDAMLFFSGPDALCVTARAKVEERPHGLEVTGADPMLEVALASSADPWVLMRRILPPLEIARAQPRLPRSDEIEPVTFDVGELPDSLRFDPQAFSQRLLYLPELPSELREALEPEASVFAYGMAEIGGELRTFNDAWSVGSELYHLVPGKPGMWKVPAGQLGGQLISQLATMSSPAR